MGSKIGTLLDSLYPEEAPTKEASAEETTQEPDQKTAAAPETNDDMHKEAIDKLAGDLEAAGEIMARKFVDTVVKLGEMMYYTHPGPAGVNDSSRMLAGAEELNDLHSKDNKKQMREGTSNPKGKPNPAGPNEVFTGKNRPKEN